MPYYVGRVVDEAESLIARTPETFREKQHIVARTLHEAVEIDLGRRRRRVRRVANGEPWWEPFDQLLIATGAVPLLPNVPGAGARGI